MTGAPSVYHRIDSTLSSRERADSVLSACFEGDVAGAGSLLAVEDDGYGLLARGVVNYWRARTGSDYSYESAKDLLSEASRLLSECGAKKHSLLADIWLGLCYWRLGQSSEALLLLGLCAESNDAQIKFLALLNQSVIHTDRRQYDLALQSLQAAQEWYGHEQSLSWRGKFFQQRGLCYKLMYEQSQRRDDLDKALLDYEAASDHYERAGNTRFEAAILNNIANLYRLVGDRHRARNSVDRALTLYERVGDRSHLAHAKDTKALILLDHGDLHRAKQYADQSVALLRNHEPGWLTIPLVTRARIQFEMGFRAAANTDFQEAISIAEGLGDAKRAAEIYLDQADVFAGHLSVGALAAIFARAAELSPSREIRVAQKVLYHASAPDLHSLRDVKDAEHKQEHEIILRALEGAGGSVTKAAKVLGKTHGGLTHIIKTRHPELLKNRRPVVRRRRATVK